MEFTFRQCGPEYIDRLCAIQEEAFEGLEDGSLLRRNSREMLASCLLPPHVTIGAFDGDELAAFCVLYAAGASSENLGRKMGLSEEEALATANFKLVIVRPRYRGQGLQRRLGLLLEQKAAELGFRRLCSSVSPRNLHSTRNFIALGYSCAGHALLYDGLERDIYSKEIQPQSIKQ